MAGINLDAILGEQTPQPLIYKGEAFELPAELPAVALAPFLNPELGLIAMIAEAFKDDDSLDNPVELVIGILKARPTIPVDLIHAAKACLDTLLGDRADEFHALQPSVKAYWALASNLGGVYGLDLTDFFDSGDSSESDGTSLKPTSPTTTPDSTLEASGDAQVTADSSEPATS